MIFETVNFVRKEKGESIVRVKLLIVDDEIVQLNLIGKVISRYRPEYEITTTHQPEQALHSYKENLDAVIASGSEDVLLISKCWFDCGRVYDICGAQSQTLNCYSNAVSYIDQIRKIDCFGCAKLCYEAALVYAKNNVAEKAAHLLAFGEACLQTMDAELADSLLALIKAARSSL